MIEFLRGDIAERTPAHVVVDCHGVGYLVHITGTTYGMLPEKGVCKLYIHYAVSVDVRSGQSEHRMFGFAHEGERQLFRQLIGVQGVSTTIGLAILSARRADDLRTAILTGDEGALKSVKGIGPKLAQRIVSELQSKLLQVPITGPLAVGAGGTGNTLKAEALSALVTLGLDRAKAERSLQSVLNEHKSDPPPVEELIRLTLKNL
jgi:Holliday junction DNA helicase RuvA